jgi:c-di-GMP phosphodiesterase
MPRRPHLLVRQPILDRTGEIQAYELLHRPPPGQPLHPVEATMSVIRDTFLLRGLKAVSSGVDIFINIPEGLLDDEVLYGLPRERVVMEVLEDVQPTAQNIAAVKNLRDAGYRIAMDDVIQAQAHGALLDLADIIKVDFFESTPEQRKALMNLPGRSSQKMLAEKVETLEQRDEANKLGFELFQGFWYRRPKIVPVRDLPPHKSAAVGLIAKLHAGDHKPDEIAEAIKRDIGLTTRLLTYLNSANFGLQTQLSSIRRAVVHLGERPLQRWATMAALDQLAEGRPPILAKVALERARFCELVVETMGMSHQEPSAFSAGLFSTLDSLLGTSMMRALEPLGMPDEIKHALSGRSGPLGRLLALAEACELGREAVVKMRLASLGLRWERIVPLWPIAQAWADGVVAASRRASHAA